MASALDTPSPPGAAPTSLDHSYQLEDRYRRVGGRIFLSGTQALVRALLTQSRLDRAAGLNTGGFVSGYRGSPLGGVDQQLWRVAPLLEEAGIRFLPAVNEELAATAVLGSQRVEADPERTVDGVFALWYGKGPGVDRAGDALRHGNAYGASPHGGVVVALGDDHGCVSSSMPHQSDVVASAWSMPVLHPASVAEVLEFALYGWALSRFSGTWVGLKTISETVESAASVDLGGLDRAYAAPTDFTAPAGGLHNRWPDLPSVAIEARLADKLAAVAAFARANPIDRTIAASPGADLGILSVGKAHLDLLEALRRLGLSPAALGEAGIRIHKIGLAFPLETSGLERFVEGLEEVLVIEEKTAFVETQVKQHLYNRAASRRPRVIGKTDLAGSPLLPGVGELRPSRILPGFARWLAEHRPTLDRRAQVVDLIALPVLSNEADGVRRTPYFCSGCPHNTSTRVPEGSIAQAGIGCHFMASWMERSTVGLIQMGGEGVDWAAHGLFTRRRHIFQNLGDGTYFHSGILALRQAVAARANVTYKILYNDAVAMTGGQPVDGPTSVPRIARQVEAEGIAKLVVVSDAPEKYRGHENEFPRGTTFHGRAELDTVQRALRDIPGVTVLIYDQACAAEKRRRRKQKTLPDPARRIFINAAVCEGCGDCGQVSNCLSVEPLETPLGRKRRVNQTSCNKDYACVGGFCPSFVSVIGAEPQRAVRQGFDQAALLAQSAALPEPANALAAAPYDLLVTGVGGTGVVTVGALISMAAHLEGRAASVLDFMGFAQKGGAVLSFVRIAARPELLNQVRIDTQQADFILACDLVVGASPDALQSARRGRTYALVNAHRIPTDAFVRHADAELHADALVEKIRHAVGAGRLEACDAGALARQFLGDAQGENIVLLGHAWQRGRVPVSLQALERAIELNGVAVAANRLALAVGRLAAERPEALAAALDGAGATPATPATPSEPTVAGLIADRCERLLAYGGPALVRRYRALADAAVLAEAKADGAAGDFARTVAAQYARLLMVKDEYEVARLYTDGSFAAELAREFAGRPQRDYRVEFHMAPPLFAPRAANGLPRKIRLGGWLWPVLKVLAALRVVRGGPLDLFGRTLERRVERQLACDYAAAIGSLCDRLGTVDRAQALAFAKLPEQIRGFGHVKLGRLGEVKAREAELAAVLGLPGGVHGAVAEALARQRALPRVIPVRRVGA